jgi:hypothetical protein
LTKGPKSMVMGNNSARTVSVTIDRIAGRMIEVE